MKPIQIKAMLDLALDARKKGEVFNPMFTGEAGLGKSQVCQSWVKDQRTLDSKFGFLDLRIAYMESPDLIGFPKELEKNGTWRTIHCLPGFWPTEGRGLLLLEEPNRGTTGVMNCLMQLLTDRKVHEYVLPEGWVIAACINPDSAEYDVNAMDTALRDRFEEFEVEFDHVSFLEFIEAQNWDSNLQMYLGSGMWTYKTAREIAKGAKYISPRTWSKMNAAEIAGVRSNRVRHRLVSQAILGKDVGNEYHKFCYDQAPVTAQDILKDKKAAIKRLTQQCDKNSYAGDMVAQTVESIVKNYGGAKADCKADQIDENTMAEIASILPADHAVNMVKECGFKQSKGQVTAFFKEFVVRHPELAKTLKANIQITRATGGTEVKK